jgi:hypothetical protein
LLMLLLEFTLAKDVDAALLATSQN